MRIESSVDVSAPPEKVWAYLLDLERVTPCMPGAVLEEMVDERTWKGKMTVKVGPVSLTFATTVVIESRDDDARAVTLQVDAREVKGRGMGTATVTAAVEPHGGGESRIEVGSEVNVAGAVARYGQGMITSVSERLAADFASCIGASLGASETNAG